MRRVADWVGTGTPTPHALLARGVRNVDATAELLLPGCRVLSC
jgi:hypothetical protein